MEASAGHRGERHAVRRVVADKPNSSNNREREHARMGTNRGKLRSRVARIATASLFLLTVVGFAVEAVAQKAGPMDEKALQILQGMSDHLVNAKTISFRARTLFDEVQKSGIKIKMAREVNVLIKRPKQLRTVAIADDGTTRSAWFNGSKLTVLLASANQYMGLDFEGNTDALLDELIEKHEVQLPLADLLYSNIGQTFNESVISAQYVGLRTVNGVQCHHLSFESTGSDWQIWVQADATPVPRRFAITYVNNPEKPEFLAALDRWSTNRVVDDDQFKASLPGGIQEIKFEKQLASE